MPEQPFWSADDTAADEASGVGRLASAALASPTPGPDAEQASRERVLRQYREDALSPRPLHPATPGPAAPSVAQRLGRVLRNLLGR